MSISEQPAPASLKQLEHEYSRAANLDPAWAAKPLALTRHEGRTILVLSDPGGESLDRILDRGQGQPLELTRCLRIHRLGDRYWPSPSARPDP
jgi:hypothetical protein